MYKGIKRKPRKKFHIEFPTKFQMLQEEQEIINGVIVSNLKVKTKDMKADPNLNWFDFEVNNLLAAGIDVKSQAPVFMNANREKMADAAEVGNEAIEIASIVKELEQERNQQ